MAAVVQSGDDKAICWGRGDSDPKGFEVQNSDETAKDVTGFSFKLTVNSDKAPPDQDDEQFTIVGVLEDATNGLISFAPTVVDTDITPDIYFYDIEQTDVSGAIKTLVVAKCTIFQDITKI